MVRIFVIVLFLQVYQAQVLNYNSWNMQLLARINPDTSVNPTPVGNRYSGCWGWFQANKNREYVISGTANGTYFVDITNPNVPVVCDFVGGKTGCTWREIKTYQNYCYVASDDAKPNTFQIIDMQYLPDSVHVVHNSNTIIERGHTLWIDQNKLYVGMTTFSVGSSPMSIFSLATPSAPVLLRRLEQDISTSIINQVHDMYVRNDTVYASAGWQGLHVLVYKPQQNVFQPVSAYASYPFAGYNHSSFLTQNGKYLLFCDESPASLPLHMIDVQNLNNPQPLQSFKIRPQTTAHNPYMLGNQWAIVASYQDGLIVLDISQPSNIREVGYFDTYPQGGFNTGFYGGGAYAGNWGAYPFFPSGRIAAQDMQNGIFILNPSAAYTSSVSYPVGTVGITDYSAITEFIYPNPTIDQVFIKSSVMPRKIDIYGVEGCFLGSIFENQMHAFNLNDLSLKPGIYFAYWYVQGIQYNSKIFKNE